MDKIYRAISDKFAVKISYVDITDSINEICKLQKTNKWAAVALAKIAVDTCLCGLNIKDSSIVNVSYNGKGLLGTVVSEFQDNCIRGYVDFPDFKEEDFDENSDADKLTQALGVNGLLQLSRKKQNEQPFVSSVDIMSTSVDLNFMYYLTKSDQIKTFICSGVSNDGGKIKRACGISIQLLPDYNDDSIDLLEEKLGSISNLEDKLIAEKDVEKFLSSICDDVKILETSKVIFKCTCSEEKAKSSIDLLSKEDIKDMKNKGENIEILCDFCKKQYIIKVNEI